MVAQSSAGLPARQPANRLCSALLPFPRPLRLSPTRSAHSVPPQTLAAVPASTAVAFGLCARRRAHTVRFWWVCACARARSQQAAQPAPGEPLCGARPVRPWAHRSTLAAHVPHSDRRVGAPERRARAGEQIRSSRLRSRARGRSGTMPPAGRPALGWVREQPARVQSTRARAHEHPTADAQRRLPLAAATSTISSATPYATARLAAAPPAGHTRVQYGAFNAAHRAPRAARKPDGWCLCLRSVLSLEPAQLLQLARAAR